jgi:very-short-patch-repair endonuclease
MATDIERATSIILDELGYRYHEQYELYPYIVDFYIPEFKIAIEADGDVWHAQRRDRKRDMELMMRYRVRIMHFWDYVIMNRPDSIKERIVEEINRTKCL